MKYFSKRNLYKVLICLILFLSLICGWTFYSLKQFDALVYPWQLKGLSNANEYYGKNISDYLLKNGSLYKVSALRTDRQKIFDDKKFGLQFKYQEELTVKSSTKDTSDYKSHIFIDKDGKDVCSLSISKGFMVNSPKVIESIKHRNKKGHLKYIRVGEIAYWFNIGDMNTENGSQIREVFLFKDGEYRLLGFGDSCEKSFIDNTISTLSLKMRDTKFVPEYFPKDIDISEWKVYRNSHLDFEIRLPKSWSCQSENRFGELGQHCSGDAKSSSQDVGSVTIYIPSDNKQSKSKDADFRENVREKRVNGNKNTYFIQIDSEDGFIEKMPGASVIVFDHNQDTWIITIKEGSREVVSDGILKSFKFIN